MSNNFERKLGLYLSLAWDDGWNADDAGTAAGYASDARITRVAAELRAALLAEQTETEDDELLDRIALKRYDPATAKEPTE